MADWPPKKNAAFNVHFPIYDADGDLVSGAAGLDSEVSIDHGTFADCTNEATEIATSSGVYYLTLAQAEMNGDIITTITKTSTSGAKTAVNVMYTVTRQILDLAFPATSGRSMVVDANGLVDANAVKVGPTGSGTAQTARDIGASVLLSVGTGTGQVNLSSGKVPATIAAGDIANSAITAAAIATDAIDADAIAADAVTEIQSGLATASALATVDDFVDTEIAAILAAVDTEVAAIKAKTDSITFSVAGMVDANVVDWKGATAPAMTGDAYARLGAPAGASVSADILVIDNFVDDLESRLTATRAGYLDQLEHIHDDTDGLNTKVATIDGIVDSILADTNELQTDWTNGGRLDLILDARASQSSVDTIDGIVDSILADTGTDGVVVASLGASACNAIADALLKRDIDQVEATAALHSLTTAILKAVSRIRDNAGTLEVYRTDGVTLHMSQTISTDANNAPIDELTAGA